MGERRHISYELLKQEQLREANPQVESDLEMYSQKSVTLREREEKFAEIVAGFNSVLMEDQRLNEELMALDDKVMALAGVFIRRLKR